MGLHNRSIGSKVKCMKWKAKHVGITLLVCDRGAAISMTMYVPVTHE